ncbi:hypothetical protein HMPREF9430_01002 [Solobacterium moorei F0204]|uniref:Phage protein Gp37/Gp68 n=2 Tax=Solobacterium moorei TaxID=102148 RepID=E7MNB1_9FIRM|nr:hypothetical protein HMPREF9430_01002 [Solobacterium moorei F0204]
MYFLDQMRAQDGSLVRLTSNMKKPLAKNRKGEYKIKSGELIRVCMTSDFFLEEADAWRTQTWDIMRIRSDVKFFLLTKRPERILSCLPSDWGDGWENIMINVTAENQKRADERIPILLDLPFKHKGIMCAPLLSEIHIEQYLSDKIEQIIVGGENYNGSIPCHYEWVKSLYHQATKHNITFAFIETGTYFVKDGKTYHIPSKTIQSKQAFRSGLQHQGRKPSYILVDQFNNHIPEEQRYQRQFDINCTECGSKLICNGIELG